MDILDKTYVLSPSDNYRGLPYGEFIVRWNRWLMSENPDEYRIQDFLFFRGNIGHHTDANSLYRAPRIEVEEGTAIFIPVITTLYSIGDSYNGSVLTDEERLRRALYEHVNAAGPFWATIQFMNNTDQPTQRIVKNLEYFRFESPLFNLKISDKNPFLTKMDVSISPGEYTSLAGGYFILIKNLPPSMYRFRFGGKGLGKFHTDSLYEVNLLPKKRTGPKDLSDCYTSSRLQTPQTK
jgi:hypothetical protein